MLSLSAFDLASSGLASHRPSISTKPTRRAASTWAGPMKPVPIIPALIVRMREEKLNKLHGYISYIGKDLPYLILTTLVQPLDFFEATTDSRTATHFAPSTKSA